MHPRTVALLLLSGCHFFVPDTRTPADRAREVAPRVEPAYSYVQSGPGNREARLQGARIHLRPIDAMSRESIARSLECHESRLLLGTTPPVADDPYALASQWLNIDVESEKDGFAVQVETDDLPTAREVLERAKRFAATRSAN
jgi:hypothetical protein